MFNTMGKKVLEIIKEDPAFTATIYDPAIGVWEASDYTKTIDAIDKYISDATHTGKQKEIKDELNALINNLEKVEKEIAKKAPGKRKIKPFIRKRTPPPAPPAKPPTPAPPAKPPTPAPPTAPPTVSTSALPTDPTTSVSVPVPPSIHKIAGIEVDTDRIKAIANKTLSVSKSGYKLDDLKQVAKELKIDPIPKTTPVLAKSIYYKLNPIKPVRAKGLQSQTKK